MIYVKRNKEQVIASLESDIKSHEEAIVKLEEEYKKPDQHEEDLKAMTGVPGLFSFSFAWAYCGYIHEKQKDHYSKLDELHDKIRALRSDILNCHLSEEDTVLVGSDY